MIYATVGQHYLIFPILTLRTGSLANKGMYFVQFVMNVLVPHCRITHSYLLKNEERLECIPCDSNYSLKHVLIDCVDAAYICQTFYNVNNLYDLFTIKP
jgi:hypothetical protein